MKDSAEQYTYFNLCAYSWRMYSDKLETRELRPRDTPKQLLPGQQSTRGIHL